MKCVSIFIFLAVISFFSGCAQQTSADPLQGRRITILHTNDHHGRYWYNDEGQYGIPARQTLLKKLRQAAQEKGSIVFLVSAGDVNTGTPESDLQDARPDFLGMDAAGYDAMVLGNHEFDNPISVLLKQKDVVSFPFLSANVIDKKKNKLLVEPYTILDRGGVRVGVLGLTTKDTITSGNPEYLENIDILDPIKVASRYVQELHQKTDFVMALTHLGYYEKGNRGINSPGDIALANAVSGIDLIVGGHTHTTVCMVSRNLLDKNYYPTKKCRPDRKNNTYITQAGEWGKYVGQADFVYTKGAWKLDNYQLFPVNYNDGIPKRERTPTAIDPDPDMLKLLKPFQEKGQKELSRPIAKLEGYLNGDRHDVRIKETNLGRLIATVQMKATNADVGVVNGGGIRDSIQPGQVRYKDVLRVHPFANRVCYVDVTGRELKMLLARIARLPQNSGAFTHFAGAEFTLKNGQIEQLKVFGQGEKLVVDDQKYRLALNSFSAAGGDNYPVLNKKSYFVDTKLVDASVLTDFFIKQGTVRADDYMPQGEVVR